MSNSSKALRDELNASQVENHIPSVDNSVAISKYFEHANNLYKQAVITYTKGEWTYAYVQFRIFLFFSMQIRKHNAINLNQHVKAKIWLGRADNSAFHMLEVVVSRLDEIEDRKLQEQEDLLSREFYGSSDEEEAVTAPASEYSASVSAPMMRDDLSDAAGDIALEFPGHNDHTM